MKNRERIKKKGRIENKIETQKRSEGEKQRIRKKIK